MNDPMLAIIDAPKVHGSSLNRIPDLQDNIDNVRTEFHNKPEVCHKLAEHIIYLRRNIDVPYHTAHLFQILESYRAVILQHYNVRWMLSICDTIVDVAPATRSAIAMNIVQCINGCNLHNTLLVNAVDGGLQPQKLGQELKVPTWGGMVTADTVNGDMIYNMMCRLDKVVAKDELLFDIWKAIKDIGRMEHDVPMNHVCKFNNNPHMRLFFQ